MKQAHLGKLGAEFGIQVDCDENNICHAEPSRKLGCPIEIQKFPDRILRPDPLGKTPACLQDPFMFLTSVSCTTVAQHRNGGFNHTQAWEDSTYHALHARLLLGMTSMWNVSVRH